MRICLLRLKKIFRTLELKNKIEVESKFTKQHNFYNLGKGKGKHYSFGESGCGICKIFNLSKAGITHLKVVGRGNQLELLVRDVGIIADCIRTIKEAETVDVFEKKIKDKFFSGKCPSICYYQQKPKK